MGHKVNPVGFRLGFAGSAFGWQSQWFAKKGDYGKYLLEDLAIRKFLDEKLKLAGLVLVKIERLRGRLKLTIQVSRPGVVIGRGGRGLEELKRELAGIVGEKSKELAKNLEIDVEEVKNAELSARLVAQKVSFQIERRMPYRRVIGKVIDEVMAAGALGVKIILSGRIAGAEIARVEKFLRGKVSLSTLEADVDYAEEPALTRSGYVGVKVYINRGETKD